MTLSCLFFSWRWLYEVALLSTLSASNSSNTPEGTQHSRAQPFLQQLPPLIHFFLPQGAPFPWRPQLMFSSQRATLARHPALLPPAPSPGAPFRLNCRGICDTDACDGRRRSGRRMSGNGKWELGAGRRCYARCPLSPSLPSLAPIGAVFLLRTCSNSAAAYLAVGRQLLRAPGWAARWTRRAPPAPYRCVGVVIQAADRPVPAPASIPPPARRRRCCVDAGPLFAPRTPLPRLRLLHTNQFSQPDTRLPSCRRQARRTMQEPAGGALPQAGITRRNVGGELLVTRSQLASLASVLTVLEGGRCVAACRAAACRCTCTPRPVWPSTHLPPRAVSSFCQAIWAPSALRPSWQAASCGSSRGACTACAASPPRARPPPPGSCRWWRWRVCRGASPAARFQTMTLSEMMTRTSRRGGASCWPTRHSWRVRAARRACPCMRRRRRPGGARLPSAGRPAWRSLQRPWA